jgi:hypothetical protein
VCLPGVLSEIGTRPMSSGSPKANPVATRLPVGETSGLWVT